MKSKNSFVIELKNVTKKYTVHHEKPTLMERVLYGKNEEFTAISNINLTIKTGERVGIIGPNGSGKTTLLKLITGISTPTSGEIKTNGKIVSLIDLEAGFHPDLTGLQNIYLSGMLMGIEKKEITRKLPSIIKFADIGNFIDASLFTYSSGMKLRLGFATAAFTDPSIIVIDENISVGDYGFRQKIWKWINNFIKSGNTVILATHEEDLINTFCNRIIELKNGIVVHSGKNFSKVKKTLKNKKNKGNK